MEKGKGDGMTDSKHPGVHPEDRAATKPIETQEGKKASNFEATSAVPDVHGMVSGFVIPEEDIENFVDPLSISIADIEKLQLSPAGWGAILQREQSSSRPRQVVLALARDRSKISDSLEELTKTIPASTLTPTTPAVTVTIEDKTKGGIKASGPSVTEGDKPK